MVVLHTWNCIEHGMFICSHALCPAFGCDSRFVARALSPQLQPPSFDYSKPRRKEGLDGWLTEYEDRPAREGSRAAALHREYEQWCERHGVLQFGGSKAFFHALQERGVKRHRFKYGVRYGLRLRDKCMTASL
jgi:hypothetical protein